MNSAVPDVCPGCGNELPSVGVRQRHANNWWHPECIRLGDSTLKDAVLAYLREYDNPVPDTVYRKTLRDRLRKLVGAPEQPHHQEGGR